MSATITAPGPSPLALALTYQQAADLLGISSRSVWSLVDAGELTAIRIGRAVRIPRAEVERFIASRMEVAAR